MKRVLGFTLIELMIVVAVIAVLAIIALPMFTEQLRKGKRTEAIQAISDISLREEKWRSFTATYATAASVFGSATALSDYNIALKYYTITVPTNTATGYSITATRKGSLANDPKCGNFTMSYSLGVGTYDVTSGDKDYCWRKK
jgi:type IV pilus assembly protein PilE